MLSGYSEYSSEVPFSIFSPANGTGLSERIFKCPSKKPDGTASFAALRPTRIKKTQPTIRYLTNKILPHQEEGRDRFSLSRPVKVNLLFLNRRLRTIAAAMRCVRG